MFIRAKTRFLLESYKREQPGEYLGLVFYTYIEHIDAYLTYDAFRRLYSS